MPLVRTGSVVSAGFDPCYPEYKMPLAQVRRLQSASQVRRTGVHPVLMARNEMFVQQILLVVEHLTLLS